MCKTLATVTLIVVVTNSSQAAGQRDPFGPRGLWTTLLHTKSAQAAVKLSAAQIEKVAALKPAADDNRVAIGKILKPAQLKVLQRLSWREQGGYALFDPELRKQLDLTAEQKKRLQAAAAVNDVEHRKMKDFLARARFRSRAAMEKYIAGYRTAADRRLLEVLTAAQRKTLAMILGKA